MNATHVLENPFPHELKDVGGIAGNDCDIVNEFCTCGHKRTQHFDTLAFGHGECAKCDCPKFTWASFETETHAG